tara:strand:- start:79020 stop:79910 length:891 start_codon:yes stop_codon:yes gene_type:complete
MDWDKLRIFRTVALAGSFTAAGRELNLSQSSISRQVSNLEDQLGVSLFHRHSRGLAPTEHGDLLLETAQEIYSRMSLTEAAISEGRDTPRGQLIVTAPVTFASIWLAPRLGEFRKNYPEIDVILLASDAPLDLSMREADVAIRIGPLRQPDLIQRHLMKFHHHIYASPQYLEANGKVESVKDLSQHQIIVYNRGPLTPIIDPFWMLQLSGNIERSTKAALEVNNIYCMVQAVESGLGIAGLPDYSVQDHTRLKRVLPDIEGPEIDSFFVYPEELKHSKRVNVFRDFLIEQLANWLY